MIFNLVQYLRNQFPAENIYPMEQYILLAADSVPDRRILIIETGGTPEYVINIHGFQIKCRDIDPYNARDLAYDMYNLLHGTDGRKGKFGIEFPAVVIGSATYPAIKTSQINANQLPEGMGLDENKRSEYLFNIQIYF